MGTPDEIRRHVVGNHDVDPESELPVRIFSELGSKLRSVKALEDRMTRQRGEGALDIVCGERSHAAILTEIACRSQ